MIHLRNTCYIDWQTLEFRNTDVWVEEGEKGKIHFTKPESSAVISRTIDCSGLYVTHSFANGHHHSYSALARGMPAPKKTPHNFTEILNYIWWTIDKCLSEEMVYYSALVTAIACAKAGVTFVIDHHSSPTAIKNSLRLIAKAFETVGLSHLLCYEISDRDGKNACLQGFDETSAYLSQHQGLVGLHASFTVGDETLKEAHKLAGQFNTGIHIHVAEDLADQQHCIEHYGIRVVERLQNAGLLESQRSILGHCLHLDELERSILQASPVWIALNMDSNLNNKVGLFSGRGLSDSIMLGTDGMHSDMLQSAKSAFFAGQLSENLDYQTAYQRFRNVHRYISNGGFLGDGENSLVILDYDTPTPFHQGNFYGHFLFGLNSRHVRHVIHQGRMLVEDYRLLSIDEQEVFATSRKLSEELWKRL